MHGVFWPLAILRALDYGIKYDELTAMQKDMWLHTDRMELAYVNFKKLPECDLDSHATFLTAWNNALKFSVPYLDDCIKRCAKSRVMVSKAKVEFINEHLLKLDDYPNPGVDITQRVYDRREQRLGEDQNDIEKQIQKREVFQVRRAIWP